MCLVYGNPYLRGEMTVFLSGLLRECNSDVLVIGKRPVTPGGEILPTTA